MAAAAALSLAPAHQDYLLQAQQIAATGGAIAPALAPGLLAGAAAAKSDRRIRTADQGDPVALRQVGAVAQHPTPGRT